MSPSLTRFLRPTPSMLFAGLTATLLVAFAIKAPCAGIAIPRIQAVPSSSDLCSLYPQRGFASQQIPYFEQFNEYPPLTALLQYVASWVPGKTGFFVATTFLLAIAAFAIATLLMRWRPSEPRLWIFCLAPPTAYYSFINWDLPAILCATAGLWAFRNERWAMSGILLGVGVNFKWYPAIFLFVLACSLLGQERRLGPATWTFTLAGAAAISVVQVPLLLFARDGLLAAYRFHLQRPPELDTLWEALRYGFQWLGWSSLSDAVSSGIEPALPILLLAGLIATGVAAFHSRFAPLQACMVGLLLFLLLNKVFSPQYLLWFVPFLVLSEAPWKWIALLFLGDTMVYGTRWLVLNGIYEGAFEVGSPEFLARYMLEVPGILVRSVATIALLVWSLKEPDSGRLGALAMVSPNDGRAQPTRPAAKETQAVQEG